MLRFFKVDINTASPLHPEAAVLIIYTGGTLGMVFDETENHLVPFNFEKILEKVPELGQYNVRLTVLSLEQPIDSSNMSVRHWVNLAKVIQDHYEEYDGFVILHGTDTMAYSASALSFLLENLQKPVVFTGAQVPIGQVRTDARENFITALEIASTKQQGMSVVPEVCIYFGNLLLRGNRAKKVESRHFDAFKSGNYPHLAEAGIEIEYRRHLVQPMPAGPLRVYNHLDDRVAILTLFPGITPVVVRSILLNPELRGVVLETFGSGNAPTEPWFLDCLQEALARGLYVLNVSQCDEGRVDQGRYETSFYLSKLGVIGGEDITVEAAITKLMFVLGLDLPPAETRQLLQTPLRGEMCSPA